MMLPTRGGTSRNRALTMPNNIVIHAPFTATMMMPGNSNKVCQETWTLRAMTTMTTISTLWKNTMMFLQTTGKFNTVYGKFKWVKRLMPAAEVPQRAETSTDAKIRATIPVL